MYLSNLLNKLKIENKCYDEREFNSLGLAGYNAGDRVCTFLVDSKYEKNLSDSVVMVITTDEIRKKLRNSNYGICIVDNPRLIYFLLHNNLCNDMKYVGKTKSNMISKSAKISPLAHIAESNVIIGNNTVVEEFVSIKPNTTIGDNCVIRAGSIIGGTGFEVKNDGINNITVQHVGGIIIKDNVEIQQNTCIDRAIYPWDNTILEEGVRVNSLVQIAHGCKIGRNTEIVAHASIQGRVKIGENVWIGPGSVIRNGISIGNNSRVNMGAVVTLDVKENEAVSGNFAREHSIIIKELRNNR